MKQSIKTLAAIVCATSFLFACSKEKDSDSKSKADLLTNGSWKTIAYTTNPGYDWDGDGTTETDIFSKFDACEKDNIITFRANGDAVEDSKARCEGDTGPQTNTYKWNFSNNETELTLTYNPGEYSDYKIVALTSSTLKLSSTYTDNGISYTDVWTFSH